MPFRLMDPDDWLRTQSRLLLFGETGAGKTTSLLTWPHDKDHGLHVISCPGEQGAWAIKPDPANGVYVYVFDLQPGQPSSEVAREMRDLTVNVITGKYGPVATLAPDGVHKLNDFYVDAATGGDFFAGNDFEPMLYVQARREFINFLNLCRFSAVPNVVFTCWAGLEKDTKKKEDKSMHVWADLPGQLAKKIVGEFTACL